jgi:WD40 repeat protein
LYGTTSRDGRVRVYAYRGKTPKTLASLAFHSDVVTSVAFAGVGGGEDDGGGVLASASRDGCVALWPVFPTAGK